MLLLLMLVLVLVSMSVLGAGPDRGRGSGSDRSSPAALLNHRANHDAALPPKNSLPAALGARAHSALAHLRRSASSWWSDSGGKSVGDPMALLGNRAPRRLRSAVGTSAGSRTCRRIESERSLFHGVARAPHS